MKRNFYLTITCLFAALAANAQITITSPPPSIANYIDTFAVPDNYGDFKPHAATQTNAKWDFTIAQYPNIQFITLRGNSSSSNYPSTKFNHKVTTTFAGGLQYEGVQFYDISSSAITLLGEEIQINQIIPLGSVTGNANDILEFPTQNMPLSTPQADKRFPTSLGDVFVASNIQETKFNLTLNAFGLNNTPGYRKSFRTITDSVVGWGTVKIKGIATKRIYDNIPVLQVRRITVVTDSFYLGGNPAPKQLLDAFGLAQGKPVSTYTVDFIGQNEIDELIQINFGNSPFQDVEKVEIQQNRIEQYAVGIEKLNISNAINTYPNPITDNKILVDLPQHQNGQWTYSITNIFGQQISNGDINTANGQIILPAGIAQGNYVLTINNNGIPVSVNKVFKQQ